MLMFAAFNVFWSALVLPLSAPPYSLSHTAIGAFGLIGAAGAMMASRAGRWADAGAGQRTSAAALLLLLAAWVPIASMNFSLWWLALGVLLLDVGGQALHVTNQTLILQGARGSHSRLIGCYMLFYAVGSGVGGFAASAVFVHYGWSGVCAVGAGISLVALCVWLICPKPRPTKRPNLSLSRR
jgi:predicted MFS family arabinose efflux permease